MRRPTCRPVARLNRAVLRPDRGQAMAAGPPGRRSAGAAGHRRQAGQSGRTDRHPGRAWTSPNRCRVRVRSGPGRPSLQPVDPTETDAECRELGSVVGAASHVLGAGAPATLFDLMCSKRPCRATPESSRSKTGCRIWVRRSLDDGRARQTARRVRRCLTVTECPRYVPRASPEANRPIVANDIRQAQILASGNFVV